MTQSSTARLLIAVGIDPIGRSRLEPLGVLVFSVIMVTSFVQVGITALQRLFGPERTVVTVGPTAIAIMASTVVVKGACYFWCRLIRNSSVQALAEDAFTDGTRSPPLYLHHSSVMLILPQLYLTSSPSSSRSSVVSPANGTWTPSAVSSCPSTS